MFGIVVQRGEKNEPGEMIYGNGGICEETFRHLPKSKGKKPLGGVNLLVCRMRGLRLGNFIIGRNCGGDIGQKRMKTLDLVRKTRS